MKSSSDRILTTHVGSISRPADLFAVIAAKETGKSYDKAEFNERVKHAVQQVVRRQAECGIDIVNDGEQSKSSFNGYVLERLEGFESSPAPTGGVPWAGSRERASFPEFYDWIDESARIQRFAQVVGRENVIAGADCGFAAGALANQLIHPTVVWAKFQSLAEGARRASKVLWRSH